VLLAPPAAGGASPDGGVALARHAELPRKTSSLLESVFAHASATREWRTSAAGCHEDPHEQALGALRHFFEFSHHSYLMLDPFTQ
jgi:hypothetical protein